MTILSRVSQIILRCALRFDTVTLNASVESSFSVNSVMLVENLYEDSLVAQRMVYDAVHTAGRLATLKIDKSMLQYVWDANSIFKQALELKRNSVSEVDRQTALKRKAPEQIEGFQEKKSSLMESAAGECKKLDVKIAR